MPVHTAAAKAEGFFKKRVSEQSQTGFPKEQRGIPTFKFQHLPYCAVITCN
jgi:hypothetical protein